MKKNPGTQTAHAIYLGTLIRLDKDTQANEITAKG